MRYGAYFERGRAVCFDGRSLGAAALSATVTLVWLSWNDLYAWQVLPGPCDRYDFANRLV
jgi:hypothetical protein